MGISKKSFKTFLATSAAVLIVAGVCQEFVLNKENKFKKVKLENSDEKEDVISCSELINYEVVEMDNEDKNELYIARANNFNEGNHKIYYDIFTGKDIVGENEDSFVASTPIEYYLYGNNIKEEYSKEDLELLLNEIKRDYDYQEVVSLKKEM